LKITILVLHNTGMVLKQTFGTERLLSTLWSFAEKHFSGCWQLSKKWLPVLFCGSSAWLVLKGMAV
jgi:hypothetical protein